MNDALRTLERRDFLGRMVAAVSGVCLGFAPGARPAQAEPMADSPYIGEIRMFAGSFAPMGWAFCDGSLLSIAENDALFQLIGTTYGGDGQTTFALPDLRGRAPVHAGITHTLAMTEGTETVTLTAGQVPSHTHAAGANSLPGDSSDPAGRVPARNAAGATHYDTSIGTFLASGAVLPAGGSQPHTNMQPSLAINFILSLYGVFPTQ